MGNASRKDVEVVEAAAEAAGAQTTTGAGGRGWRPRRLAVVLAVVVTLGVAGAVVGQLVVDARERARLDAVARLPGAVRLLDGPPEPLWTLPDGVTTADLVGTTAGGALVVTEPGPRGPAVAARAATTGEVRWRVPLLDATSAPPAGTVLDLPPGRCDVGDVVVCLVVETVSTLGADEGDAPVPVSARSRLVVLDADDGTVLAERTTSGTDPVPAASELVGDLVVTITPVDGALRVDAVTTDGAAAWDASSPTSTAGGRTFLGRLGDHVLAGAGDELTVLDHAGAAVRTLPFPESALALQHGDDAVLLRDYTRPDVNAPTTVVRADGEQTVDGEVVELALDDGSVPGLLLTSPDGTRLTALDAAGDELWSRDSGVTSGLAVLAGRVYSGTGGGMVALDGRTGAEVWRSDQVREGPVVTDGAHLVAMGLRPLADGRREVLVLDRADGTVVQRAPLPAGVQDVAAVAGLLVATTGDGPADGPATVLG
ncbi:PQQ-binding-like beta-propeller repeat protein [Cellulomonas iranensis]|uniref:PQQ-binding-like beta-propeller repeat protein n=1 Tax=Cellulomonas iranensis TaxID=76862 RepID=UPI001CF191F6|nr:PQQ-binding-like beta-propeller repeat protein [Cellulomonas iranensis]UCN14707.1 PQQ-binding-like beta-propeller repeat protein [Cellulomonas iranensis]